jgi:hypothetical protein
MSDLFPFPNPIVPFYQYGLKGKFSKLYQDRNDNIRVIEFTRFSIKALLENNSPWDIEILQLYYSLSLCYVHNEARNTRSQRRSVLTTYNNRILRHGIHAKKDGLYQVPFDWNPCGLSNEQIASLPSFQGVVIEEGQDEDVATTQRDHLPPNVVAMFQHASHYYMLKIYHAERYGVLYDSINNQDLNLETRTTIFHYLKARGYITRNFEVTDIKTSADIKASAPPVGSQRRGKKGNQKLFLQSIGTLIQC